ncbi:hypothetical protein QR680_017787 [Steinernema hermaphroditum]|uniref:Sugar phosphate transporter domain-containing protein n=1 Tax=Steinernema hermaphroditum TaxID=289476 RepID=A0AA39HH11_9BILA|nr:hypothetical protein QR680_017787 [Steinernema hermaphroditum]
MANRIKIRADRAHVLLGDSLATFRCSSNSHAATVAQTDQPDGRRPAAGPKKPVMPLAAAPVAGFFSGCLGCMAVVESLAKDQPGCMNLMTFSHFLFVAVEGLIFTSKFFTVRRHIPVRAFWKPVLTFFLANVINNQTLNFNIPVPLYIIFRSSDLLGNLVLSRLIQKRTYSWRKYAAVFLITIGIVVCTLATSSLNTKKGEGGGIAVGVILLVIGLTLSSYLPIAQEELFAKFGRHDKEALLMNHLLPLPLFAVFWNDIVKNAASFTLSTPVDVLGISTGIPYLWLNLFVSAFLQWICLRFVYLLTASVESLTKTLFTNLRKFLSLVLSIVYFQNPFTPTHWLGTAFVFLGVLSFIDVWERKVTGKKDRSD